jgi:hypothetical protein
MESIEAEKEAGILVNSGVFSPVSIGFIASVLGDEAQLLIKNNRILSINTELDGIKGFNAVMFECLLAIPPHFFSAFFTISITSPPSSRVNPAFI